MSTEQITDPISEDGEGERPGTWYRLFGGRIEEVEVERVTPKRVVIGGRMESRVTTRHSFHPSREEAVRRLLARCRSQVRNAEAALKRTQATLARAIETYGDPDAQTEEGEA